MSNLPSEPGRVTPMRLMSTMTPAPSVNKQNKIMSPLPPRRRNISPPFLENDDDSLSRAEIEGPVPLGFHSS